MTIYTSNKKFNKKKPSLYKLTSKQIKQLIYFLTYNCSQEELNNAIGYMSHCPYCNSEDFYKTNIKSNLYKFKCERCKKIFNILSRSSFSYLLHDEAVKLNQRFTYKDTLKNIEVWLYFDINHDRKYNPMPRKNSLSTVFRLRHNLLQIPKDLKKNRLVNIHERDEESFNRLISPKTCSIKKKKENQSDKKFIILTLKEGEFAPKKSILELAYFNNSTHSNPINHYMDEHRKKEFKQEYDYLKNKLIQSYTKKCETLHMPNREDSVYKNIENPYKHTYLLAYEMAIRNDDVKARLYALDYMKDVKKNLQTTPNDSYSLGLKDHRETLISKYLVYLPEEIQNKYLSIGLYKISNMIDDFEQELRKKYLIVPKSNKIVTPESSRILMQRILYNTIDPKKYKWSANYQKNIKYKFEEKEYDDYTNSIGIFDDEDVFDISIIRPTFNLHIIDKNTSLVPINFTLPTEEIVAFIEKVKKDLEKDGNIIVSPFVKTNSKSFLRPFRIPCQLKF